MCSPIAVHAFHWPGAAQKKTAGQSPAARNKSMG